VRVRRDVDQGQAQRAHDRLDREVHDEDVPHRAPRQREGLVLEAGQGAEGVGRATTESVVYASITILISNFFLTLVLGKIFGTL